VKVRPSIGAGWYPGDAATLRGMIETQLDAVPAPGEPMGRLIGLLAPHAGLVYSGPVAAHAYRLLRESRFDLVTVVAPLHRPHAGAVLVSGHDAYRTPLGDVPVDRDATDRLAHALAARGGPAPVPVFEELEHAVEMQLPFLQVALGQVCLLPVLLRKQEIEVVEPLGHALADVARARPMLLVASSDLSHFHPQDVALGYDREMLRRVVAFDPDAVLEAEDNRAGFACGRGAIAAMLWATRDLGGRRVTVLDHATSGDTTGDRQSVVGYAAVAVWA